MAGGEGGKDDLGHHLRSSGHVEEHFTAHVHFAVGGVEEEGADLLADGGGAGVTHQNRALAGFFQMLKQKLALRGLPTTFGAIEDNEPGLVHAGKHGNEIVAA